MNMHQAQLPGPEVLSVFERTRILGLLSDLMILVKSTVTIAWILLFWLVHRVHWGEQNQRQLIFLNLTALIDPYTQEAGCLCCHKPQKICAFFFKKKRHWNLWEQLGKQLRSTGLGSCHPAPQVTDLTNRVHQLPMSISAASSAFPVIFKAIIVLANQQYNLTTTV